MATLTPEEEKQMEENQIFVSRKLNKAIFRVKGKHMVKFAEALGDLSPKYIEVGVKEDGKPDFSKVKAHACYPNCFIVDLMWDAMNWRFPADREDPEGKMLITVPSKILHVGQSYDYSNAEIDIKHKQKLYTTGYCKEIYVKNNQLWITLHLDTRTKENQLVVQSELQIIVREGGFAL